MAATYRNIGKITSVFGLKGDLIVHHHLGKKTALKGLDVIFIEEKKDELLPYFIESARIKTNTEIYLKLEGIDSKETGLKFLKKEIWLTESDFDKYAGKSAPISLVGYNMVHGDKELGEILEVIEQPHQVLCRLEMKKKEVLVPVNEATLQKIDQKNKKVFVELPEGLLDIYLGK